MSEVLQVLVSPPYSHYARLNKGTRQGRNGRGLLLRESVVLLDSSAQNRTLPHGEFSWPWPGPSLLLLQVSSVNGMELVLHITLPHSLSPPSCPAYDVPLQRMHWSRGLVDLPWKKPEASPFPPLDTSSEVRPPMKCARPKLGWSFPLLDKRARRGLPPAWACPHTPRSDRLASLGFALCPLVEG